MQIRENRDKCCQALDGHSVTGTEIEGLFTILSVAIWESLAGNKWLCTRDDILPISSYDRRQTSR